MGAELADLYEKIERIAEVLEDLLSASYRAPREDSLVKPAEAASILGIRRQSLWKSSQDGRLVEGVHWERRAPGSSHRLYRRALLADYARRGKADPIGHSKFCHSYLKAKGVGHE